MNLGSFSVLFTILVIVVTFFTINQKEGFQPTLRIPESPVAQRNLVESTTEDYAPSYVIATGPAPGSVATFNSLPYIDPSQEKAKYERILNVQTTLQGFLDNEAIHIQDLSDPSIQLPLSSARSDLSRLKNEVLVLKRNPGIESSLTQGDVDEIQANMAYLQKKWRMSVYNETSIEGFDGSSSENSTNATLSDVQDLLTKINVTIARFSASGTSDTTVQARINVLKQIAQKVQAIINDVSSGVRNATDIPITKDAYSTFLTSISNLDSPITKLFGSNVALADLFPAYSDGDVSGASMAQYLFNKYSDMIFKGLSWDVNLSYTSETDQALANTIASTLATNYNIPTSTSLLGGSDTSNGYFNDTINNLQKQYFASKDEGEEETQVQAQGQGQAYQTTATQPTQNNTNTNGTKFNWKERANFICDSIDKRGLNPDDFACLRPDQYVSEDFSWRGYAKMVCTRLGTSYDTGLPETCGCPPTTWIGWKP